MVAVWSGQLLLSIHQGPWFVELSREGTVVATTFLGLGLPNISTCNSNVDLLVQDTCVLALTQEMGGWV